MFWGELQMKRKNLNDGIDEIKHMSYETLIQKKYEYIKLGKEKRNTRTLTNGLISGITMLITFITVMITIYNNIHNYKNNTIQFINNKQIELSSLEENYDDKKQKIENSINIMNDIVLEDINNYEKFINSVTRGFAMVFIFIMILVAVGKYYDNNASYYETLVEFINYELERRNKVYERKNKTHKKKK